MPPVAAHHKSDAELILSVIHATVEWQHKTGVPAVIKPLRELIWFVWEAPRLPTPRIRNKYPCEVPWSPAARRAIRPASRARLIIKHVLPMTLLVRKLLATPPAGSAALVRILKARLRYLVIAPADNQKLTA